MGIKNGRIWAAGAQDEMNAGIRTLLCQALNRLHNEPAAMERVWVL